jgi:hypothetical protein
VGLLVLALACSTTSTVYRTRGMPLEVAVLGGSPTTIFVKNEAGKEYEIPRSDISSIDYPGNVHTAAGAVLAGYGVLNIAVGLPMCAEQKENQGAFCAGVFLPALVGTAIMLWGLGVHVDQAGAVEDTSRRSLRRPKPYVAAPAPRSDDDEDDDEPRAKKAPAKAPAAVYLEDDPPQVDLEEDRSGERSAKPVAPFVPRPPTSSAPPSPPPSKAFPVEP